MSNQAERYTTSWDTATQNFVFDGDDSLTMGQIVNRLNEQHQEIRRLREVIVQVWDELQVTPELNIVNYDETQVQKLNDGVNEICCWFEEEATAARRELRANE